MPFEISFDTRHTDCFANTGMVHSGVLLALTELAYARFEEHCGYDKPDHVFAVQRATEVTYQRPLRWQEGATIRVFTTSVDARSFDQEFVVHSSKSDDVVARFVHHWSWMDARTGQGVEIPDNVQERIRAAGD